MTDGYSKGGLFVKKIGLDEFGIPFLNTTKIHAESAVRYCLFET